MSTAIKPCIDTIREDSILKALSSFRNEIIEEINKLKQIIITSFLHSSLDHSSSGSPVHAQAVNLLNEMFQTKLQEFMSETKSASAFVAPMCDVNTTSSETTNNDDIDELISSPEPKVGIDKTNSLSPTSSSVYIVPETYNIKTEVTEKLPLNFTNLCEASSVDNIHEGNMHCETSTLDTNFDLTLCSKTSSNGMQQDLSLFDANAKQSFPCSECGKVFTYKSGFQKHLRIHTGARPYKCKLCGKSFTQKGSLKYHIKIHTGEKPFKCSICAKSFIHRGNLNYHVKKHKHEDQSNCK